MTTHVSWETLNDVADNQLSDTRLSDAMTHFAECDACTAQLNAIRALRSAASRAPNTIAPPPEAWTEIQQAIYASKSIAFPQSPAPATTTRFSRMQLAAAALVLVTVSSTITAVILRSPDTTRRASDTASAFAAPRVQTATPGDVVSLEQEYMATTASLRDALDKERSTLSPATIATVERNLKIIDDAITEARDALIADPANTILRDMLRKSHQQKIDFLRRTTTLLKRA